MSPKAILFVGGGVESLPGILKAKAMGLRVVVSDINPRAPGMQAADGIMMASTYDAAATVAAAIDYHRRVQPLHGVLCLATDVPLTVATVAAALGLPGIPLAVAARAMDKLAMKDRFAADGVKVPWYRQVSDAAELAAIAEREGLPLVLKPADSRGGRGVQRLTAGTDLVLAFARAREQSPSGRVMVERFLSGPQVSTESLVIDGVAHTPGFSDRNYEFLEQYAPFFIENGGDMPSRLPPSDQQAVRELVQRAATSLGVVNGVVKGDIVVCAGMPYVIEMAARLSGGWFCTHQIPLGLGVDLVGAAIRMAVGDTVPTAELAPQWQRGVAQRFFFPRPGRVLTVKGVDAARRLPGVEELLVTVTPGDTVRPPTDSNASAGMVIATGTNKAEAVARAQAAVSEIRIETEAI